MSWKREGNEVTLTMSLVTWEFLLVCVGVAAGVAADVDIPFTRDDVLGLSDMLNDGNPDYEPYLIGRNDIGRNDRETIQ